MVVVLKPSGAVRICVDLTKLNQSVQRECHIFPSVEQMLAQFKAWHQFWILANWTCCRVQATYYFYCSLRLFLLQPFSLWHYLHTRTLSAENEWNVTWLQWSSLISGWHPHLWLNPSRTWWQLFSVYQASWANTEQEKCKFNKSEIKFGQLFYNSGVHPDPDKIRTIRDMKAPTNIRKQRQF